MPGRKISLADRYLAAIQGSDTNGSKDGVSSDGAANDGDGGKQVKIEYTYRLSQQPNADDGGDKNGNTTATGAGGSMVDADVEDSNPRSTGLRVFPTSSTEEETTTDEEGDDHDDDDNNNNNNRTAAVKKREVFPSSSSSVDGNNFSKAPQQSEQAPPPEFATIPLRRVGATTAGSRNNSSGRRRLNSVASSDLLSEASEPIMLTKNKEEDGSAPGAGSGGASAADNGGQVPQSQAITDKDGAGNAAQEDENDQDEDNYSFKPIEGVGAGGANNSTITSAEADVAEKKTAHDDSANGPADGNLGGGGGGGKVKIWASKINCRADTTTASSVVGVPAQGSGLASTPLISPLVCVQPPVSDGDMRMRKAAAAATSIQASANDGAAANLNAADADDMASALRRSATMVKGSASPARLRSGAGGGSSMSDRKKQSQSPLREKEIWQRRRKERERRATLLRQEEEEDAAAASKTADGSGSVVSVPVSTLSTPATEVHTNRTSDFRRNLWLDRSSMAAAATDEGGTSDADGDDEGVNSADVANPQEEETDSESDNPDLAADAEVRRLSQSESERAAARVTTTGEGGKASTFAPAGGRVTPLMTEVGIKKDDVSIDDKREKVAQVTGAKIAKSKGELNSALGATSEKSKGELDSAIGTSRPPRTPKKISVKPGLVAARQKAFLGGSSTSSTNKVLSPPKKYRTKKSLADDISQADSSIATPAVAMTDDIVDAEVDDVAEPLPPGFTPSIKADVSLTSSTDVELGVIGEDTAPDDGDKEEGPLTGKSFKVNRASRNTGKKKKLAAISNHEPLQPPTSDVPSSRPAWAQVKLRKTPQGAAMQQKPDTALNENVGDPQPAPQKTHMSSFPVQSLRPMPSEVVPDKPQRPPDSPNRTPLMLPNTKSPSWTERSSMVESHAASSVDWAPAQFSPGPLSAGKEVPAFQDGGPAAPILLGQEYISRRVTNSVQQKRVVRSQTATAFASPNTKPVSHSDHQPRRVESFMSEDSEGVQSLRHKFETSAPSNDARGDRKQQSIRMKFEEMASPRSSGREAVTNARQVFEKKTVRDRAPQQVPLCETVFQQYDCVVDGRPDSKDAQQSIPTPKGVRDVRSTFEQEPKRFSPEKAAQRRPPQGRQSAMRRGIDTGPGGNDDDYRLRIDNWMAEVKEIRSKFDSKPEPPPPRSTAKTPANGLSKVNSKDSGDRSQLPTPRWLDIDTNKTAAVNDSPFKSFDAQAKKTSSSVNPTPRTPNSQPSFRRTSSAALSMASKALWPSSGGGRYSSSSAIDFDDAVTLSPQSTVVSELTPTTLPSATMLDNQSRDGSYSATSSTRPPRTPTLSYPSPRGSRGLKMRDSTPKSKKKSNKAASEVIPRSPDPPGKTATAPRMTDPPAREEKVDVSISPIPYRSSPKKPVASSSAPSSTKVDNQDSWKKEGADTAWTDFDAFGDGDPFDSSFTADFSGTFNAFQSEGTATPAANKNKSAEPKLDDILSPPRVTKSFDSEGSMPLDDAISISTANTPLRSNCKGDSVSFDMSDEIGLSTRPIRPKHVLTNDATSAVSKRLDELKEARRARQSGLSQPRSAGDSKSWSEPATQPSVLRSSAIKRKPWTAAAASPPRTGITSRLSQVTSIGTCKSPLRGKGCGKETAEIPLTKKEDRYLLFEGGAPVPLTDSSPGASKKKKGRKGKGLPRFSSDKSPSMRKRLSGQGW